MPCDARCPPQPGVTQIRSSRLQHLVDQLQQPCGTGHPLVLDLGGRVLTGPLREALHPRPAPTPGSAPIPGTDIILKQPCIIRNGMLRLPMGTHICVEALGCRFEDLVITGQGTATAGGARREVVACSIMVMNAYLHAARLPH